MELNWLRNFLSVARTRSFSASAREGNITQSAFSRRIQALEHWAGVPLIDRSTYPTRLTPAGERFLETAQEVEARLAELRAQLAEEQRSGDRLLRIAAQHTLAFHHLPPILARLHDVQPGLRAYVQADNIHDCLELLQEGGADLLLSFFVRNAPILVDERRIEHEVLGMDMLVPVCAADSEGRPRHPFPGTAGHPTPWLRYGRDAMLDRALSLLLETEAPVHLYSIAENSISEILRRMALYGIGIAWLPKSLITDDLANGWLVPLGGPEHRIPMQVRAYYPAETKSPAVQAFLHSARECIRSEGYENSA